MDSTPPRPLDGKCSPEAGALADDRLHGRVGRRYGASRHTDAESFLTTDYHCYREKTRIVRPWRVVIAHVINEYA